MNLVPNECQFYPATTFLGSFHTTTVRKQFTVRFLFLRYGSSPPLKNLTLCSRLTEVKPTSVDGRGSPGKINFNRSKSFRVSPEEESLHNRVPDSYGRNRFDRWSIHKSNRSRPLRDTFNYRSRSNRNFNGGAPMESIVDKLKRCGYIDDGSKGKEERRVVDKGSIEDKIYVEDGMSNSRGVFSKDSPLGTKPGFGIENVQGEAMFPLEKPMKKEDENSKSYRQKSRTHLAELTLPKSEIRRRFGFIDGGSKGREERRVVEKGFIEDKIYVEDGMLSNSRGGFSEDPPSGAKPGFGIENVQGETMLPLEKPMKKEDENSKSYRQKSRTHLAELTLPKSEIRRFGYIDDGSKGREERIAVEKGYIEDKIYVEDVMLSNSRGGFSEDSPLETKPGFGIENVQGEAMFPLEKPMKKEDENSKSYRQKSRTHLAELTIPKSEIRRRFGYVDDGSKVREERRVVEKGYLEDKIYVEDGMLSNSRGGFSEDSPWGTKPGFGIENVQGEAMFPLEKPMKNEEENSKSYRQKSRTHVAEMTLPESEIRRLKNLIPRIKSKMRITGAAGVTREVVDKIKGKWKSEEIVVLIIEGPFALNMKKIHKILERKTKGLVIWRSGVALALYRGVRYQPHSAQQSECEDNIHDISRVSHKPVELKSDVESQVDLVDKSRIMALTQNVEYEHQMDELLEDLGPRYTGWPGDGPLPVDGDLLPGIVPSYKPPFRILPYGIRSTLTNKEAEDLRRLANVLPPHFAIGRSRQLQGLAFAMVKLWEKSSIAKVALKHDVRLTASEIMVQDIKKLTGSMLLCRNKDFLVFYRGKDFLTPEVAETLLEKERLAMSLQDQEEQARLRASASIKSITNKETDIGDTGTLSETMKFNARWVENLDENHKAKVLEEAEASRHANVLRKLGEKIAFAKLKVRRAERTLTKVEQSQLPSNRRKNPNDLTEEERGMFHKIGLKMKKFLLVGRRGVFDGTVENMHMHWKYRELVKIIVNAYNIEEADTIARSLEEGSGGVLISVDRISKGYGIVVFRGRNYRRPRSIRPKNLLTKRNALTRSIEIKRRENLLHHISSLEASYDEIRSEIGEVAKLREFDNEEFNDKLDYAYPTDDDEDSEVEGDYEAHLQPYETED